MKKLFFLLGISLISVGCFTASAMMTADKYEGINEGVSTLAQVQEIAGKPYKIRSKSPGLREVEYIERITMGEKMVAEIHYYLTISNDNVVVSKRVMRENRPLINLQYEGVRQIKP